MVPVLLCVPLEIKGCSRLCSRCGLFSETSLALWAAGASAHNFGQLDQGRVSTTSASISSVPFSESSSGRF